MLRSKVLTSPRMAGQIRRYHTWPTHQQQTNADHTFNVMLIWYLIWGALPPEVSSFIIWHDLGEIAAGDPPFPSKANNPDFKAAYDKIEGAAVFAMGGPTSEIGSYFKIRVKACDLIEMHEFGLVEKHLGNNFAQPIIDDTRKHLSNLDLRHDDWLLVHQYLDRLKEGPYPCV